MNETSQLIVKTENDTDIFDHGNPGRNLSSQYSFDSFRSSALSFTDLMSESMKRIGVLGSLSIAVNSLIGPAMLSLPATYQRSGLFPTTAAIIFVCILSSLCCLHMSNSISKVPNNQNFGLDIGYSECFRNFLGPKSYSFTQVLFFCCITCLNISSIVDTAEVVDTFFGHWVPTGSVAINFQWTDNHLLVKWVNWDYSSCTTKMLTSGECVPFFDEGGFLFTIGYGITLLTFVPMAVMDLKENAFMQVIGFVVLLATSLGFVILFLSQGIDLSNISFWGTEWRSLFGVVLFNYALVIAIPAWLYEKESHVNIPAVIHSSALLSTTLYISIGVLGAITVPHASQNMLESLMSGVFGTAIQLCASIFAFFIIGLGCPLFSILARMNLTDGDRFLSRGTANWLAVYLPFFSSWVFYKGDAIYQLLSWGGIMFQSLIAFILPLLLALRALEVASDEGSVNVYKPLHVASKKAKRLAIRIILLLAVASIIAAILGNFIL